MLFKRRDSMERLKRVCEDEKLSLAAKGYFGYIITHLKDWDMSSVAKATSSLPLYVHNAFRELVKRGYITIKETPPSS